MMVPFWATKLNPTPRGSTNSESFAQSFAIKQRSCNYDYKSFRCTLGGLISNASDQSGFPTQQGHLSYCVEKMVKVANKMAKDAKSCKKYDKNAKSLEKLPKHLTFDDICH